MSGIRVALVTSRKDLGLPEDDRPLLGVFGARGGAAEAVVWDDPSVDWSAFALVIVRTPWDYYLRADAFAAWISGVAALGPRVLNPAKAVLWNMNKRYLLELAAAGLPVVPTVWVARGDAAGLAKALAESGPEIVIKPAVSAGSFFTERVARAPDRGLRPEHAGLIAARDVLVQPYLSEVARAGELSLVFLGGRFSHALLKKPAPGDFRVQTKFGGSADLHSPSSEELALAGRFMRVVDAFGPILYARVDLLPLNGRWVLGEIEIIEPNLSFYLRPEAREEFVARALELA